MHSALNSRFDYLDSVRYSPCKKHSFSFFIFLYAAVWPERVVCIEKEIDLSRQSVVNRRNSLSSSSVSGTGAKRTPPTSTPFNRSARLTGVGDGPAHQP